MEINEARKWWKEHESRRCPCEPHNPNTFCYKSIGFIEAWDSREAEVEELKNEIKMVRKLLDAQQESNIRKSMEGE